jgi:methylase of polypeptide subunit release factors
MAENASSRSPTGSPTVPGDPPEEQHQQHQQTALQIVAHQAETIIEAGTDDSDNAGYETDYESRGSTSISSSVRDYSFEHGRRYHKFREGTYQFPNDESEQAREDMKHAMVVNLCGGLLHYAPLHNPQNIIDIGTGTGIWAIDSMLP